MRRALPVAALLVLVVLAGCQGFGGLLDGGDETGTPGADGPVDMGPAPPDPEEDRLGWENGYWHNESVDVTPGDGLNESERDAVVSRAMARIEVVRDLEFEESVPVDVIDRSTYREEQGGGHSEALDRFDNAKFEALFLVGEGEDSIDVQEDTRGETVLGYYSPNRSAIVLVSNADVPTLSGEEVLAHELVHALQDQHFDLQDMEAETRDAYQGRNGIVEGDASYVQRLYMDRCGEQWDCLDGADGAGTGGDEPDGPDDGGADGTDGGAGDGTETADGGDAASVHPGIQVLEYFPYSDGPGFVESIHDDGGWAAVNDVYDDVPDGAAEVTEPSRYPDWEPTTVDLADRTSAEWDRIEPPNRPDYGVMGQSAIVAAQAYTITDQYNETAVVLPQQVVNFDSNGNVNTDDPYQYDTGAADGWAGGRFHAYERDDGELAYVWRTRWEDEGEAAEFAANWQRLVDHWGGDRVAEGTWEIEDSEFEDAIAVRTDGTTVTVVNAPSREALDAVHGT